MQNKKLLLLSLALVVLVGGAALLYPQLAGNTATELPAIEAPVENTDVPEGGEAQIEPGEAQTVPNVTVYDAAGNAVELASYFGKPIVMNFWASWCPPCKAEMPDFEAAYKAQGEEIRFLMVNMTTGRETLESAAEFLAAEGYTFPVLYDLDGAAAAAYGTYFLPTTYFIDANGYAVARADGAISADILAQGIDMIRE